MPTGLTICAGTVGSGIWQQQRQRRTLETSEDGASVLSSAGDVAVRALAVSPHTPHLAYAGSEVGASTQLPIMVRPGNCWNHR